MPNRPADTSQASDSEHLLDLRALVILVLAALGGVAVGVPGGAGAGIVASIAIALGLHKIVRRNRS